MVTTPIARSKSAALSRVQNCVPKGYFYWTAGSVRPEKAHALANKFHALYGIGCTPSQRMTRKAKKHASAVLVLYWPEDAEMVEWLMLATEGSGMVRERPRLTWLGYEFLRRVVRGKISWTWKRPKQEMRDTYAHLDYLMGVRHESAVAEALVRLANQPGFAGVRDQGKELIQHVRGKGYRGEVPKLFYIQKISHREKFRLADPKSRN